MCPPPSVSPLLFFLSFLHHTPPLLSGRMGGSRPSIVLVLGLDNTYSLGPLKPTPEQLSPFTYEYVQQYRLPVALGEYSRYYYIFPERLHCRQKNYAPEYIAFMCAQKRMHCIWLGCRPECLCLDFFVNQWRGLLLHVRKIKSNAHRYPVCLLGFLWYLRKLICTVLYHRYVPVPINVHWRWKLGRRYPTTDTRRLNPISEKILSGCNYLISIGLGATSILKYILIADKSNSRTVFVVHGPLLIFHFSFTDSVYWASFFFFHCSFSCSRSYWMKKGMNLGIDMHMHIGHGHGHRLWTQTPDTDTYTYTRHGRGGGNRRCKNALSKIWMPDIGFNFLPT